MFKKLLAIAVVAVMILAVTLFATASTSFVDVPEDAYYAEAAERMAARNILSGYGDGYYYGDQSITRAQVAALVCKMLGKVDEAVALAGKTNFNDVAETSWATGYVNYAVNNGIIVGDGDGNFRPDDSVKYEEVIKVIVCVLGLDENVKIDPTDWSKEFIEAADKAGLIDNLIGKKGQPMLRSDIAVICDAAMTILDAEEEEKNESTTTSKPSSDKPSSGITTGTTTTESTTASDPAPSNPDKSENVTTIVTLPPREDVTIAPPPPPEDNESGEY